MRPERERLKDVLRSIEIIERCVQGMEKDTFVETFTHNEMLADAVSYRFIVIGEAINHMLGATKNKIPLAETVKRNPHVDWKGYAAMRNIFAHQYFRRSPGKIWTAIEDELPALKKIVSSELERLG